MSEPLTLKEAADKLRAFLATHGIEDVRVLVHEGKQLVRLELPTTRKPLAALVVYGKVSTAEDGIVVIIPLEKVPKVLAYRPQDVKYGKRRIEIDGEMVDAEYATLRQVGITVDGSFTLDVLGRYTKGMAGVVPFNDKGQRGGA